VADQQVDPAENEDERDRQNRGQADARFRKKLCQALLSANLRFRNIFVIPAGTVISGNLPRIDRNDAAAEKVDDLTVVSRHHNGGPPRVDAQKSCMISHAVAGSRLPVGSSAMIMRGACTSARAIATRCCSPPDRFEG